MRPWGMRQVNVVLRHKKDRKGIPSNRFVSPSWKILKVTKVTTCPTQSQLGFYMVHGVHGSCLEINGRLLELCINLHLMQRSCPRTFQVCLRLSDALDVQNSPHCLQNSNEDPQNKSPSATFKAPHLKISLALATGDSTASGASRLRTLKTMGKPWPSPCRSEEGIPALRDIWEMKNDVKNCSKEV